MKTVKLVTSILVLCLLTSLSFSQDLKPLAREVQKKHQQKATFTQVDNLLKKQQDNALSALVAKEVRDAKIFNYDQSLAADIINQHYQALTLDMELDNKVKTIEVVLVKESFNDYILNTSSGNIPEFNTDRGIHYRGIVLGEENTSLVAFSIFKNEMIGVISIQSKGDFSIGKLKNHDTHIMYNDSKLVENPKFECLTDDANVETHVQRNTNQAKSNNPEDYCIDIYFEVDHEIYQNEGNSVPNTETFVMGLFNQTAAIYQNESITVQISEIFVWDTPDSYSNSSASTARGQFVAARPTFNGDLAQLLEYRPSGAGGIAYGIGGLCGSTSSPGPYAVTSLFPDFEIVPLYSRQVKVLTHEMGHNFGSRHTHACVWNGNNTTYDDYGNYNSSGTFLPGSEGASCVDQMNPKLNETATIMSYFDSYNHGTFPMSNGFGDQPGDVVRQAVLDATCLTLCNPITCSSTITNFPYTESFETDFGDWQQDSGDDFDWTRNSGSTSSTNTGPSNAADGSFYAYVESTVPNHPNKVTILNSPCFDLTAQGGTNLSFAYHMYGESMGTLDLQVSDDNGATWTSEWDLSGDQGNTWFTANVDLSAYAGSIIQLRYVGTTLDSYRSDMAVDDIMVTETLPCNNTITSFPYTESFESDFGDWEQVTADDFDWSRTSGTTPSQNTGPSSAADGTFYAFTEASFQNHPDKTAILMSPCFDLSGQNTPIDLNFQYHMYGQDMGKLILEVSDDNGITWTELWAMKNDQGNQWLPGDADLDPYAGSVIQLRFRGITFDGFRSDMAIDDISISGSSCIGTVTSFPYIESFETDFGIWSQDLTEDFDWTRNSGSTPSFATGPDAAHDGVWYAYTESSVPNNPFKSAHLNSPCIDLTGQSTVVFNFWYHMLGQTMGTLAVEATVDQGASWNTLFVRTGEQGKDWIPASVNLSSYAGQVVQLRFVGKTIDGFQSDMAIDDMSINTLKGEDPKNTNADNTPLDNEPQIIIYPNPASNYAIINYRSEDSEAFIVTILDMLGKEVYTSEGENGIDLSVPTDSFAPGSYMIVIRTNTGATFNKKLIVRN